MLAVPQSPGWCGCGQTKLLQDFWPPRLLSSQTIAHLCFGAQELRQEILEISADRAGEARVAHASDPQDVTAPVTAGRVPARCSGGAPPCAKTGRLVAHTRAAHAARAWQAEKEEKLSADSVVSGREDGSVEHLYESNWAEALLISSQPCKKSNPTQVVSGDDLGTGLVKSAALVRIVARACKTQAPMMLNGVGGEGGRRGLPSQLGG